MEKGGTMGERRRKITRKDVAAEAGVSETIVSYVLNNNRYVKKEKRERVLAAVEKLHYQPDHIARALHGKGSSQILFIAEELSSGYFPGMVSQMSREAYQKGYMISLCESQKGDPFVSQIISRQFDGLLISASGVTDRQLTLLSEAEIPMVIFQNREISQDLPGAVYVDTGLYEGSRSCVRYLVQQGYQHLLYVDKLLAEQEAGVEKDLHWKGFVEECKALGLSAKEDIGLLTGCGDLEEMKRRLQEILEEKPWTDAIVARYDELAAAALSVAKKLGRKVPRELAVVGFDNDFISGYVRPSLTTVEIPREEVGRQAIESLLSLIHREPQPKRLKFDAKLIIRESTGKNAG